MQDEGARGKCVHTPCEWAPKELAYDQACSYGGSRRLQSMPKTPGNGLFCSQKRKDGLDVTTRPEDTAWKPAYGPEQPSCGDGTTALQDDATDPGPVVGGNRAVIWLEASLNVRMLLSVVSLISKALT